jgi:Pyruvate/2-oxoacid:ferredoxin oxidoreductase gamma subunit
MTYNILICGTGGQGVPWLARQLRSHFGSLGHHCEGATFKGGAQRMGSVYSELRIQKTQGDKQIFSSQIPVQEIDLIIGLEPFETLRFLSKGSKNTKIISHNKSEELYVNRVKHVDFYTTNCSIDPIEEIRSHIPSAYCVNFQNNNSKALNENILDYVLDQKNETFLNLEI